MHSKGNLTERQQILTCSYFEGNTKKIHYKDTKALVVGSLNQHFLPAENTGLLFALPLPTVASLTFG